jgi:hypothetical protein
MGLAVLVRGRLLRMEKKRGFEAVEWLMGWVI